MCESVLKAILQFFAIVFRVDDVSKQEREQVRIFLEDHLSKSLVSKYSAFFETYLTTLGQSIPQKGEKKVVSEVCEAIGVELTQKQKVVIVFELIRIILADGEIHPKEEVLVKQIASNFRIPEETLEGIKTFVLGADPAALDFPSMLLVTFRMTAMTAVPANIA